MKRLFHLLIIVILAFPMVAWAQTAAAPMDFYYQSPEKWFASWRRTKVTSEEQLLKLMRVTDKTKIPKSKEGLLRTYQARNDPLVKQLWESAYKAGKKDIILNGGVDSRGGAFASKEGVFVNANAFTSPETSADWGKGILLHEFTHACDSTGLEAGGYGIDGMHAPNEVIAPQGSFLEGFADFSMIQVDEKTWKTFFEKRLAEGIYQENVAPSWTDWLGFKAKLNPKAPYVPAPLNDPKVAMDKLMRVEAYIALTLHELAKSLGKDGQARLIESFKKTHNPKRTFRTFLQAFAKANPEHLGAVVTSLNRHSQGKFDQASMEDVFGKSPAIDRAFAGGSGTPTPPPVTSGGPGPVKPVKPVQPTTPPPPEMPSKIVTDQSEKPTE